MDYLKEIKQALFETIPEESEDTFLFSIKDVDYVILNMILSYNNKDGLVVNIDLVKIPDWITETLTNSEVNSVIERIESDKNNDRVKVNVYECKMTRTIIK